MSAGPENISIEKAPTKKVSTSQAFSDGFMAAIFRKPEIKNPYNKGTLNYNAWNKGHESGQRVVDFHTARIRTTRLGMPFYYQ